MRDTCRVGNQTTAKVLAALSDRYELVLTPFGEGSRYDLLIDEGGKFIKVQCKTGRLKKNGSIIFNNYSQTAKGWRQYKDDVDVYGVYCSQTGKTYLVPVNECTTSQTSLRIVPAKNGMKKNIRLAEEYEI